jgi:hypothetical protein
MRRFGAQAEIGRRKYTFLTSLVGKGANKTYFWCIPFKLLEVGSVPFVNINRGSGSESSREFVNAIFVATVTYGLLS